MLCAFRYEQAYVGWFGVPPELIRPDTWTLLRLGAMFFPFILFSAVLAFTISGLPWIQREPIRQRIVALSPLLVACLFLMYKYGTFWREGLPPLYLCLAFISLELLYPLRYWSKARSYSHMFLLVDAQIEEHRGRQWLRGNLRPSVRAMLMLSVLLVGMSSHLGQAEAMTAQEFTMINDTPPRLVLRNYAERLISAEFYPSTGQCVAVFSVLTADSISRGLMQRVHVDLIRPCVRK